MKDKHKEKQRYDRFAEKIFNQNLIYAQNKLGSSTIPYIVRDPYIVYEKYISNNILKTHNILEIGSGTGLHTYSIYQTGAQVTATDISLKSLEVLKHKISNKIETIVTDIEYLPFKNESFDWVVSAGVLGYGNSNFVDSEIIRVLRKGGSFLCVDSLNHNPIYKLNRWLHTLKGSRGKIILKNLPTQKRINDIASNFKINEVKYFGSISFIAPLLEKIIGKKRTRNLSNYIDEIFKIKKSAFKIVMLAQYKI